MSKESKGIDSSVTGSAVQVTAENQNESTMESGSKSSMTQGRDSSLAGSDLTITDGNHKGSVKEKMYRGVGKTPWGRFTARIRKPSTKTHVLLGTFDTAEEAAGAYDAAAREFLGPNATINFPPLNYQNQANRSQNQDNSLISEPSSLITSCQDNSLNQVNFPPLNYQNQANPNQNQDISLISEPSSFITSCQDNLLSPANFPPLSYQNQANPNQNQDNSLITEPSALNTSYQDNSLISDFPSSTAMLDLSVGVNVRSDTSDTGDTSYTGDTSDTSDTSCTGDTSDSYDLMDDISRDEGSDTSDAYEPLNTDIAGSEFTYYDDVVIRSRRGDINNNVVIRSSRGDISNDVVIRSTRGDTSNDVVIISRRGDISKDDFITHLRAALSRREISVHEDLDEVNAVPECRILIIFFTSTYVPSNLFNILEQQRKESRVVYPIFYGISPSELSELISNSKNYVRFFLQDEPKRWQTALKEITQMPSYALTDKSESELIDEIVSDALKVLSSTDKVDMIGMDMQIKEILSLLCIDSPDVVSLGIWGTVGIGKTSIAKEIFRRISVHFETCVFLEDFHDEVEVKGHDAVREDFLSKILEVDSHVIRMSHIKSSFMESRLQRKRVLVILDDVNDFRDVETFIGKIKHFGPGSKVLITSRNRRIFMQCKVDQVYEVKPLDISKSLLLLECGTSRSVFSFTTNRTYSHELVKFSNGNPKVLLFLNRLEGEWQGLSQQIQKTSPIYIPGIFEKSCCGLDDNERSIFLDIACFFKRMDKDNLAMLLDGCGFSTHVGFRSLVDKSLLTISHNMVDMHGFIQATGREVVRRESIKWPGERSRLWNSEDIMDVLIDNTGTSAIEGIFLDISELYLDATPHVFEKMCNLRLLKFYRSKVTENCGVSFPQGLEYLPSKLRLLHWEYYPLSSLPKSFDPKNLVELNLPNSSAKKLWKGKKSLEKLKKIRLSNSYQLTTIPKLSRAPNLEHIDLEGCNSLVSISQSICYLKKLTFLNLKNCSKLESVPSTVDLESLEVLNLSGCSKLESFPEISPNVKELYLGGTMIQEIPSSIKNLVLLEKLDLENSRHLKNLPTSICKLKHLETLNLSGCSSFERFPDLSRRMKCLKSLDLSRTAIKELPSSISYLTALEELRSVDCKNLVRLPSNTWSLRFKVEFREIDTEKFSRLWNRYGWLKKVKIS